MIGRLSFALALGAVLVLAFSGPVAAYYVLSDTGTHGYYKLEDDSGRPGGKCGYSAADAHGIAYFRWMKVMTPEIWARDITAGRDAQKVSWKFKLQRSVGSESGPWRTVATSPTETVTAHDDTPASLTVRKASFNGTDYNQYFRAVVTIKWLRHGAVEGSV